MMGSRRSHPKSRLGCRTCKQRRVKCDETGPPCGACKVRKTPCDYDLPASLSQKSSNSDEDEAKGIAIHLQITEPGFPSNRRLLEMQLMNRWSIKTFKSLCTPVIEDEYMWQTKLPEMALKYDFLLNGLFALAAFDVAGTSKRSRAQYVSAAVEYQSLALGSFRPQLHNLVPDDHEPVLFFSLMLMVIALASAQFISDRALGDNESMVQNTITHFELLRGCAAVVNSRENYLAYYPHVAKLKSFADLPRVALDPATVSAISKLNEANEKRITASVSAPYEYRVLQVSHWEACKKAISLLQECFAKCVEFDYQGYVLGWLNMAGDEYVKAIKIGDNVALLILMFWGVLIERLGHKVWWSRNFGKLLVEEISNKIPGDNTDLSTKEIVLSAHDLIETTS